MSTFDTFQQTSYTVNLIFVASRWNYFQYKSYAMYVQRYVVVRVTIVSINIHSLVIAVDVAVNNINVLWVAMERQQWVPLELQNVMLINNTTIILKIASSCMYEGNSISKLQIVIEKNRMEIMTYKQHLFFIIISIQI